MAAIERSRNDAPSPRHAKDRHAYGIGALIKRVLGAEVVLDFRPAAHRIRVPHDSFCATMRMDPVLGLVDCENCQTPTQD